MERSKQVEQLVPLSELKEQNVPKRNKPVGSKVGGCWLVPLRTEARSINALKVQANIHSMYL